MTSKVDGTNGVLQAYDYQVLTTGFSYTFAAGTQTLVINPAGTLATGTITMPASPVDGMVINIESTKQITDLTVAGNTGQTMTNGAMTLRSNQPVSYMYRLSNTTWYPYTGASNSQLISGTSIESTSGTSIDFTSIPSWVKRITVMLNGVSTNGTDILLCQIGTSSGIESSAYFGTYSAVNATPTASLTVSTVGFPLHQPNNAADLFYGQLTLTNLNGNIWVAQGCFSRDGSASDSASAVSGGKTLSGVLDRLRIIGGTAGNPSNTFDAGSINIMYE